MVSEYGKKNGWRENTGRLPTLHGYVDLLFKDGTILYKHGANNYFWGIEGNPEFDIVAYRLYTDQIEIEE